MVMRIARLSGLLLIAASSIAATDGWSHRNIQPAPGSVVFDVYPPNDGTSKQYKNNDIVFGGNIRKSDAAELNQSIVINRGGYEIDFSKVDELNLTNFYKTKLVIKLLTNTPPIQGRLINPNESAYCTENTGPAIRKISRDSRNIDLLCLIDEQNDGAFDKYLLINSRNEQELLDRLEAPVLYKTRPGAITDTRFRLDMSIDNNNFIRLWPRIIKDGKMKFPDFVSMHMREKACILSSERISWTGWTVEAEGEKRNLFGFVIEFTKVSPRSKAINISSRIIENNNYIFVTSKSWIPELQESCAPGWYREPSRN